MNAQLFLYLYRNDSPPALVQVSTTGRDGNFTFVQLLPGLYQIKAQAPGYEPSGEVTGVEANRTTWANLTLRPPPAPGLRSQEALNWALVTASAGAAIAGGIYLRRRWRARRKKDESPAEK